MNGRVIAWLTLNDSIYRTSIFYKRAEEKCYSDDLFVWHSNCIWHISTISSQDAPKCTQDGHVSKDKARFRIIDKFSFHPGAWNRSLQKNLCLSFTNRFIFRSGYVTLWKLDRDRWLVWTGGESFINRSFCMLQFASGFSFYFVYYPISHWNIKPSSKT